MSAAPKGKGVGEVEEATQAQGQRLRRRASGSPWSWRNSPSTLTRSYSMFRTSEGLREEREGFGGNGAR